jgi:RimJ/RimL family protein N-acetyltransferase
MLRARVKADVLVLHAALHDDPSLWAQTHGEPWTPVAAEAEDGPFMPKPDGERVERFTVVTPADDEIVGSALLWGIDSHNRTAHAGLGLLPAVRGRGLGTDILRVLCHYGFVVRGMRRLQLETLEDNAAMIGAARRVGFVLEGSLRSSAYVEGRILDEVIMGLLADEYVAMEPETGR